MLSLRHHVPTWLLAGLTLIALGTPSAWAASADLAVTKSDGQTTAAQGSSLTYTVVVSNLGPDPVVGAAISDTLPSALEGAAWSCVASPGSSCSAAGSGDLADTFDLLVGGTATYSLTGTVADEATGTLVNTAAVVSPAGTGDPVPGNNTATDTTALTPLVDLSVTTTDGQTTAVPGTTSTYTVTVANAGPAAVTGATVSDVTPPALTCTWTCIATGGATCSGVPLVGALTDTVSLPATAQAVYTGDCAIDPAASGGLIHQAAVSAPFGTTELALANNTATDVTTLTPVVDLAVTADDGVATAVPGDPAPAMTLVVTNDGPSEVVGAVVVGDLDADLFAATWTCLASPGGSCTAAGTGDIADTVDLAVGSSLTYVVTGTVPASATGSLDTLATVTAPATVTESQLADNQDSDSTVLTPQVALALTKTDGATTAVPGETTTYTVVVSNAGPSDAPVATVTDTPPASLACSWTCVATPGASCAAGPVVGALADGVTLPAGTSLTYTGVCDIAEEATGTVSNTAMVESTGVAEADLSDNQATDLTTLEPVADLRLTVTDGRTEAVPGESLTYSVTVDNAGPSAVEGARVLDTFPSELTCLWSCVASGGGTCTAGQVAGDIDDTVSLPVGADLTFTADCTIAPGATGTLTNTATVTPPSGVVDPFPADATASDVDTVLTPQVDLTVSKTDGLDTLAPGEALTYTVEVGNDGPSDAVDTVVTDTLPTVLGPTTWSCVATAGSSCPATGSGDLAETVTLLAGGQLTFTLATTLDAEADQTLAGQPLSNTATVAAAAGITETDPSDNSATDTTSLEPRADLGLTKTDGRTTAVPGEPLTYTLVASNDGPSAVLGATLIDVFPSDLEAITWTCAASVGSSCPAAGTDDLSMPLDLAVGGSATVTVEAQVRTDATGILANTATLEAPSGVVDPALANNTASDVDTVLEPLADLQLSKDDGVDSAVPGTSLTYTLVATNLGPSAAPGVTLVDVLPTGVACTWTCQTTGDATCPASVPAGSLNAVFDLGVGGTATFTGTCGLAADLVDQLASTQLVNTASLSPGVAVPGVAVVDPTPADATAEHTTPLTPRADLVVSKTDGRNTAAPGEVLTYTLVATNLGGPSHAAGASVVDTFPSSLDCTWSCIGSQGASCGQGQGVGPLVDSVDLPPGGTATYTALCTLDAEASGSVVNTVTLTPLVGLVDSNPSNNSALDTTTVEPRVDLAIQVDDGVTEAVPGETLDLTVVVSNPLGPPVLGAEVVAQFPASLDCTWGCGGSGGGVCTPGQVTGAIDDLVDLPAAASVTYSVLCTIDPAATGTLTTSATVSVPAGSVDPDPSNNSASDLDTVLTPRADLAVSKTDGVTVAHPGDSVTYTVLVGNPGPSTVTDLRVEDTPPSELDCTWTCSTTNGATCDPDPQLGDLVDFPDLPAASTVTYTGTCGIDGEASGTLSNTASLTPPVGFDDPNPGNDQATDDDTDLVLLADLSITLDDGVTEVVPGTTVTYTLVARHDPVLLLIPRAPAPVLGPVLAQPISPGVIDVFPTALDCSWTCVATPGSACQQGPVAGDLLDTPSLAVGGSATYTAVCGVASSAVGTLENTASLQIPAGVQDLVPANDQASDLDLLTPEVDLVAATTDGALEAVPGGTVVWTVEAVNLGPSDAPGAQVENLVDPALDCLWSCVPEAGATCLPGQLAGDLLDTANLPAGARATYTGACTIDPDAVGSLSNSVTLEPAAGIVERAPNDNTASDLDTVLVPTADLVVTKTDGRTTATPGTEVVYTVRVENPVGPSTLRGVAVDDVPPASLDCLWGCQATGGAVCNPGQVAGPLVDTIDLPPGAAATYALTCAIDPDATGTLSNTASIEVPTGSVDPDLGNNSATDADTVLVPEADLVLTKTDGTDIAVPGGLLTYTVEASNLLGPSSMAGVVVSDLLPSSLSCLWTCMPLGGAVCTAGPVVGDLNDTVDLPAGARAVFTAECTVDPAATGTLLNQASLALPAGAIDPDPTTNTASDLDTLEPQADLVLGKSDGLTEATPGESLTYQVTVHNAGPSDAPGNQLGDLVPAGLDCLWTCTTLGGAVCDPTPQQGDLAATVDLPAGSDALFTGSCAIAPEARGTLSNTATIATAAGILELEPDDNHATDDTLLVPRADLAITKSDGQSSAVPGDTVVYELGVSNSGPSDAFEVTVRDLFPTVLTCAWSCSDADTVDCEPGPVDGDLIDVVDLPARAALTYVAACAIDPAASGSVSNTATVEGEPGIDPDLSNNSATDVDLLSDLADLAIVATDEPDPVAPGGLLTYVLEITNHGPVREPRVVLTDLLPGPVTLEAAYLATPGLIFSDGFESGTVAAWNGGLTILGACDAVGGTVTCDLGPLAVDEQIVLVLETRVSTEASGTLINNATVEGEGNDPDSSNDTAVELTNLSGGS